MFCSLQYKSGLVLDYQIKQTTNNRLKLCRIQSFFVIREFDKLRVYWCAYWLRIFHSDFHFWHMLSDLSRFLQLLVFGRFSDVESASAQNCRGSFESANIDLTSVFCSFVQLLHFAQESSVL